MSEIPGFKDILDEMYELHKKKNNDYSGQANPFKNFELCEQLGICSVQEGILVRMSDKMSRISTLKNSKGKVKDESIRDTYVDLANYSVISICYDMYKKGLKK